MPGVIPYAHQQFYAQQQGIGYRYNYNYNCNYNYGYTGDAQQFGGASQGGFGCPQVMGHNQGYGGASHVENEKMDSKLNHDNSGTLQKEVDWSNLSNVSDQLLKDLKVRTYSCILALDTKQKLYHYVRLYW